MMVWFSGGGTVTHCPSCDQRSLAAIPGSMEDEVPDMGELVMAFILVQVQVEYAYIHRLTDTSPVLICFMV